MKRLLLVMLLVGVVGVAHGATQDKVAPSLGSRIKHIIVLMEENRSFDHLFGYAKKLLGVNGLDGSEFNRINRSDPKSSKVLVDNKATYIGPSDPAHSTPATASKLGGGKMDGFVEWERKHLDYSGVMSMFSPERVPIVTELAQEYAVMDEFFCSHAGPTWPNRMYALSATSAGSTETGTWYKGKAGSLFPQRTIFDQVSASSSNLTWKNYYNDTPWELFMESIAHNPDNLQTMEAFYKDAAEGTLPSYAWINPRSGINMTTGLGSDSQHPDHDVALGERLIKDVYEALRASPNWNDTLFIVTYDEHGGFYDHVTPPSNVPSPGDAAEHGGSYPDKGYNFTSLGVRIPTLLISPWIKKGTVVSAPPAAQRVAKDSAYDLTSIIATARKLLPGMDAMPPLTRRDAWAGTFEHVLAVLDAPRGDMPLHLGPAPQPTLPSHVEANRPLNDLQQDIAGVLAHLTAREGAGAGEGEGGSEGGSGGEGGGGRNHPTVQAEISEWFQSRVNEHKTTTAAWLDNIGRAPMLNVSVQAMQQPVGGWLDATWSALPAVQAAAGTATTISTMKLRSPTSAATPYCLDTNGTVAGSVVAASVCYPPKVHPNYRQDQQWLVQADATIRPARNAALCLTAPSYPPGLATLQPCQQQMVQQHWTYHGPNAPGNNNEGFIQYGDFANFLGIQFQ